MLTISVNLQLGKIINLLSNKVLNIPCNPLTILLADRHISVQS